MTTRISRYVRAPIGEVLASFEDPATMLEFSPHADRFDVTDQQPEGRRTYDVVMRSETDGWMQTLEQVRREPPSG